MSSTKNKGEASSTPYQTMDITAADIRSRQSRHQPISLLKFIFDGLSLILILSTWLIFKYFIRPVRRPFLCSDLNLYHPRPPANVIPTWLLFVLAVLLPALVILLSEGIRWYYLFRTKAARVVYKFQFRSRTRDIPELLGNLYIIIGIFIFAAGVNSFLTNVGKVAVGRHRPHFIPSCFNKFTYKDFCTDPNLWIVNYTCLGEESSTIIEKDDAFDIRQSFPSGHSSTAFCGLIFLALYIHKVWNYRNMGLFPYIIETGCFALAAYIGFTRLSDNRHHGTDVLAGAILGTLVTIIAFRFMVRSLRGAVPYENGDSGTRDIDEASP